MSRSGFELCVFRRVFPSWSIVIPESFDETFVTDEPGMPYWHGYDDRRSISLTSFVVDDGKDRAPAALLLPDSLHEAGTPVDEMPEGLVGKAVIGNSTPPARASKALSGVVAADGRALIVTITSDDLDWARMTWKSISHFDASDINASEW